jgi:hypothetical protein
MKGIFSKKEPKDLFAKLQKDFDRLKENQLDEDAALDFFITAESLTDWFFPGRMNKEQQMLHRNSSILLQIVSHIASSAKHFKVEAKHHNSVSETGKVMGGLASFGARAFRASTFKPIFNHTKKLVIYLDGEAKDQLGESIEVNVLATKVLEYWHSVFGISKS